MALQLLYLGTQTDKRELTYDQYACDTGVQGIKIEARCYRKSARFTALVPFENGENYVRYILPLVCDKDEYLEDPEPFIEAAVSQAKKKAWWLEADVIQYDDKGVPFYEDTYTVGVQEDAMPGEVEEIKVRFRFYPKSVKPMVTYYLKPVKHHRNSTSDLLERVYIDEFNANQYIGALRRQLKAKGYDLSY